MDCKNHPFLDDLKIIKEWMNENIQIWMIKVFIVLLQICIFVWYCKPHQRKTSILRVVMRPLTSCQCVCSSLYTWLCVYCVCMCMCWVCMCSSWNLNLSLSVLLTHSLTHSLSLSLSHTHTHTHTYTHTHTHTLIHSTHSHSLIHVHTTHTHMVSALGFRYCGLIELPLGWTSVRRISSHIVFTYQCCLRFTITIFKVPYYTPLCHITTIFFTNCEVSFQWWRSKEWLAWADPARVGCLWTPHTHTLVTAHSRHSLPVSHK